MDHESTKPEPEEVEQESAQETADQTDTEEPEPETDFAKVFEWIEGECPEDELEAD